MLGSRTCWPDQVVVTVVGPLRGSPALLAALASAVAAGAESLPVEGLLRLAEALHAARQSRAEVALLSAAEPSVVARSAEASLRQLAGLVEAYALAGLPAGSVAAAAAEQASARLATCDAPTACRLLKAFRSAEHRPAGPLLPAMASLLAAAAPKLRPPALVGALRSFAALGAPAPGLFAAAPSLLLPRLAHLHPVQLAYLAWALVSAGDPRHAHGALLAGVEASLLSAIECSGEAAPLLRPAALSALIRALSAGGRPDSPLFQALAPAVTAQAAAFLGPELSRVLLAYAAAECPMPIKLEVFSALEDGAPAAAACLPPAEIAALVSAFTQLGYASASLFDAARQRALADALGSVDGFGGDDVAAGVWALTALHDFEAGGYRPTTGEARLVVTSTPVPMVIIEEEMEEEEEEDPWAAYEQHCVVDVCSRVQPWDDAKGTAGAIEAELVGRAEEGAALEEELGREAALELEPVLADAEAEKAAPTRRRRRRSSLWEPAPQHLLTVQATLLADRPVDAAERAALAAKVGTDVEELRRWRARTKARMKATLRRGEAPVAEETEIVSLPSAAQAAALETALGGESRLTGERRDKVAAMVGVSIAGVTAWWAARLEAGGVAPDTGAISRAAALEAAFQRYGKLHLDCQHALRAELGAQLDMDDVQRWFRWRHQRRRREEAARWEPDAQQLPVLQAALAVGGRLGASRRAVLAAEVGAEEDHVRRWWARARDAMRRARGAADARAHALRDTLDDNGNDDRSGRPAPLPSAAQAAALEVEFAGVKRLSRLRRNVVAAQVGVSSATVAAWSAARQAAGEPSSALRRPCPTARNTSPGIALSSKALVEYGRAPRLHATDMANVHAGLPR